MAGRDADGAVLPSPPRPAPAPPPGLTIARWLFVDAARSHEVRAGLRASGREFVVKESAYANDDPDEVLETVTRLDEAWEAPVALASLERRLAALGAYWKHDSAAPGWQRLPDGGLATPPDLRPADVGLHAGRIEFHPFRKRGAPEVVIIVVPALTPKGARYWTGEATIERSDAERAPIRVLHARLPVGPWRSLLAARHIDLAERDHEKVRAPDADALGRYRTLLERISQGRLASDPNAREAPVDDLYTDYLRNLTDPRLLALHARFLTVDEEAAALAGGELAIRQLVARKRASAARSNDDQMMLTLLEASLLARDGLRAGNARVDPEVAALVRRFANYL